MISFQFFWKEYEKWIEGEALYKSYVGSYVINIKAPKSYMSALSCCIVKLNEEVLMQYSPNIVIHI